MQCIGETPVPKYINKLAKNVGVSLRHNAAIHWGSALRKSGSFRVTMQPNSGFGRLGTMVWMPLA